MDISSHNQQVTMKNTLNTVYADVMRDVFDYLDSKDHPFNLIHDTAKSDFELLLSFTPINFYWVHEVHNLISLNELNHEIKSITPDPECMTDEEEMVFDEWAGSVYSEEFLELINDDPSIYQASHKLIKKYELNLVEKFNAHIARKNINLENYIADSDLGDIDNELVLIQNPQDNQLEGYPISFLCHNPNEKEKMKTNLLKSLDTLKRYAPKSFQSFTTFTNTVVSHPHDHIVSYSSQYLPGHSIINLTNRDFIDQLDDLIHENGHHYLNTYLIADDLITEEAELIYYSPWRKELRPLRGIYHGILTFYWGFKLFQELINSDFKKVATTDQLDKIHTRLLEEYLMISTCKDDITYAYKAQLISQNGFEIVSQVFRDIETFENFDTTLKQLNKESRMKIQRLTFELIQKKEKHKKLI